MIKRRIEPFLWLLFSGGGVMAAVFLPILVVLFALAIPLGLVHPDYSQLHAVFSFWLTRLVVLGLFVLMLFHWAHRFKYTLIDGLRLTHAETVLSVLCYGAAVLGSVAVLLVVLSL